jgi:hypothetical protein
LGADVKLYTLYNCKSQLAANSKCKGIFNVLTIYNNWHL